MVQYTIVTQFRDRDVIAKVQEELRNAGVVLHHSQMIESGDTSAERELESRRVDRADIDHYLQGLNEGYPLLVATVDEADRERAVDILDNHGPVDMRDSAGIGTEREAGLSSAAAGLRDVNTGAGATERGVETGREEVIPVTEEEIRVGKRTVERGRVRVRSYVVETPVEESVRLRDERVHVERRAVSPDRPAGEADFQERTLEVRETAEEAVVAKEARIVEEVVVQKETAEREKTISDTVRRTEVEVDDGRTVNRAGKTDRTDI